MIIFKQKIFRRNRNKLLKNRVAMRSVAQTPREKSAAERKYPIIKGGTYNDSEFFQKRNLENRDISITQTELIQKARGYGINDSPERKIKSLDSTLFLISKEARKSNN